MFVNWLIKRIDCDFRKQKNIFLNGIRLTVKIRRWKVHAIFVDTGQRKLFGI